MGLSQQKLFWTDKGRGRVSNYNTNLKDVFLLVLLPNHTWYSNLSLYWIKFLTFNSCTFVGGGTIVMEKDSIPGWSNIKKKRNAK